MIQYLENVRGERRWGRGTYSHFLRLIVACVDATIAFARIGLELSAIYCKGIELEGEVGVHFDCAVLELHDCLGALGF